MRFSRTARLRDLNPRITKDELISFLESRGLLVHNDGKGGVSIVTEQETAVATVTFKDHDVLDRSVLLSSSERRFRDGTIAQIDVRFDGFTALSDGTDVEYVE